MYIENKYIRTEQLTTKLYAINNAVSMKMFSSFWFEFCHYERNKSIFFIHAMLLTISLLVQVLSYIYSWNWLSLHVYGLFAIFLEITALNSQNHVTCFNCWIDDRVHHMFLPVNDNYKLNIWNNCDIPFELLKISLFFGKRIWKELQWDT